MSENFEASGADSGTDTGVSASTPDASVSVSSLTDDQVLDKALAREDTAVEPAKTGAETPDKAIPATESKEGPTETEVAELEGPYVSEAEPEAYKRIFKTNPELKRIFHEHAAHKEVFPTIAEARQMREAFPTPEDAQRVMQQADTLLAVEQAYLDTPDRFLAALGRGNPEAFKKLAESIPAQLHQLSPELYRSAVAEPVTQSLLMNLARRAERDGDEELAVAVQLLGSRLFGGRAAKAAAPTDDPRFAELEQFKQAEGQRRQETVQNFDSSLKRTIVERLDGTINEAIAKLAPALGDKAMSSVRDEILSGVIGKLTGNPWLNKQAQSLQRTGDYGTDHLNQIAGFLLTHAQPLIAPTVKKVLSEWTSEVVQANVERRTEAKKAAERKDIGAGSGNGVDAKSRKVVADADFYKKFTDDDIVNKRHLAQ